MPLFIKSINKVDKMQIGGNPKIAEISKRYSTGPKSKEGKTRVALNAIGKQALGLDNCQYSTEKQKLRKKQILDIFTWISKRHNILEKLKTDDELTKLYNMLKSNTAVTRLEKVQNGGKLTKTDLDEIRLLMDILVNLHKMVEGTKVTIEKKITMAEFRRVIIEGDSTPKEIQDAVKIEQKEDTQII